MTTRPNDSGDGAATGAPCPICVEKPSDVIAELEGCWLTMRSDAAPALPGTCALFLKNHAVELHDLSPEEARAFMAAAQRVSSLLARATAARKINYEIHGNTIAHLHMHFFPRYTGDPFAGRPIDPRVEGGALALERHLAIRKALVEALRATR